MEMHITIICIVTPKRIDDDALSLLHFYGPLTIIGLGGCVTNKIYCYFLLNSQYWSCGSRLELYKESSDQNLLLCLFRNSYHRFHGKNVTRVETKHNKHFCLYWKILIGSRTLSYPEVNFFSDFIWNKFNSWPKKFDVELCSL